jgi:hypothetical protein
VQDHFQKDPCRNTDKQILDEGKKDGDQENRFAELRATSEIIGKPPKNALTVFPKPTAIRSACRRQVELSHSVDLQW